MAGSFFLALILAAAGSVWIYYRFQRTSGNNTQQSVIAAGVCAAIIFIVVMIGASFLR